MHILIGADKTHGGPANGWFYDKEYRDGIYITSASTWGIVGNKLKNGNITYNYPNDNNIVLFPEKNQAEDKNLVGENKPYKEILRDYQMPFIKESSGYYYFDSDKHHIKINRADKKLEIHEGKTYGKDETGVNQPGLFPFNKDCYIDKTTDQYNDMYYTMKIEIPFYMTDTGKTINWDTNSIEDMVFKFSGDDDVWIFVDDNLVLDLGGTHNKVTGELNFAKNQAKYDRVNNVQASIENMESIVEYNQIVNNVFGDKSIEQGYHKMTMFYTERAGGASNFSAIFNLEETTNYTGTKIWKDNNNSQGLRPQNYCLKLYANDQYIKQQEFQNETWEFANLQKYNYKTGKEIIYTVKEDEILLENGDKYTPTITGTKVVNTLTGTKQIEVKKIWNDKQNKNKTRPTNITFIIKKVLGGE